MANFSTLIQNSFQNILGFLAKYFSTRFSSQIKYKYKSEDKKSDEHPSLALTTYHTVNSSNETGYLFDHTYDQICKNEDE